jgi:exonuclease VII small subunit
MPEWSQLFILNCLDSLQQFKTCYERGVQLNEHCKKYLTHEEKNVDSDGSI